MDKIIGSSEIWHLSHYEYWESSCRNNLASFHDVDRKFIISDIFGDLRHLRNSLLHHQGIALPEIENCKKFKWYKCNDNIFIDGDKMEDIVSAIKEPMSALYRIDSKIKS